MVGAMTERPDGIYFGLPEDEYHADPAIGSSTLANMLVSPLTAWAQSNMNPEREERDTAAQALGSAFHRRLLEPDRYAVEYATLPDKDDYPEAIDGGKDLQAKCAELGVAKNGTIADMCARILAKEPEAILWPVILADWLEDHEGLTHLKPDMADKVERMARIVEMHPEAKKAIRGGVSEVSIFWHDEETGLRCKGRLDYLNGAIVDVKSFANSRGLPIERAVAQAVAYNRYDLQAVHYTEGLDTVKRLLRAGKATIEGEHDPEWVKRVVALPPHTFIFLFVESCYPPNVEMREFGRSVRGETGEALHYVHARQHVRAALETYKRCYETWGTDPWVVPKPLTQFRETDFPMSLYD
jgi:hypothetical protein